MAIDYTSFFTKTGKAIDAYKKLLLAAGSTTDTEFQEILDAYASEDRKILATIEGIISQMTSLQNGVSSQIRTLLVAPTKALLVELVKDDINKSVSSSQALDELLRQMENDGESIQETVPTIATSGTTTGNGSVAVSLDNVDGRLAELAFDEPINLRLEGTGVAQNYLVIGDISYNAFNKGYPGGSGVRSTKTVASPSSASNLVTNGTIATADVNDPTTPAGWISAGSTTASITAVQADQLAITGTPTTGHYQIELEDADGIKLKTRALAFNATAAAIQTAVQELSGYADTTVVYTAGTTPNFTYKITYNNRPNGVTLTVDNNTDVGVFTPTVLEAGGNTLSAGRSISVSGDGAENLTYYIPVTLRGRTAYFVSARLRPDTVTAGTIDISLVDTIEGTTDPIQNNEGDDNTISQDVSALTDATWADVNGFFRTPTELPSQVYLKVEFSVALDAAGTVDISDILLKSTSPVYSGGPYIELTDGSVEWALNDRPIVTVTNAYSGEFHDWFERIFGLRATGRLFPTSNTPTRSDSLIS